MKENLGTTLTAKFFSERYNKQSIAIGLLSIKGL